MDVEQQLKMGFLFLVLGTLGFFVAIIIGLAFPQFMGAFTGFRFVVIPLFIVGLIMVYQIREEDVTQTLRFRIKFMKRVAWVLLSVIFITFLAMIVVFLPGLFA